MTKQNEGSSKTANKAAKEFAKYSSPDYKQEAAGEFGGATVTTGYVAPNKLDEKMTKKYSGESTTSPVGYAGTMGGATPANRMTQETATELNPATKGKKNFKKTK